MINLYYDNIIDGVPAPNGTFNFEISKDARRIPYVKDYRAEMPIAKFNTFYFVMKANKTVVNLVSGKPKNIKNLYYPIELNYSYYGWNRNLTALISPRAKSLIKKGRLKLLILAPRLAGNSFIIEQLKQRVDEIVELLGIKKSQIYIVLGELNNVYRTLLDTKNVFGIDWWQIYMQLVYKVRSGLSSLSWICEDPFLKISKDLTIDHENWNPKKVYNTSFTNYFQTDVTVFLELAHNNLLDDGYVKLNSSNYNLSKTISPMLVNPRSSQLEKESKQGLLKHIDNYSQEVNNTLMNYNIEEYQDTVLSILCDDIEIDVNTQYKQEVASFTLGPNVWKHIYIGHPAAIIGCSSVHNYLNNQGYFSCNALINQHYDTMYDPTNRAEHIRKNIEYLKSLSSEDISELIAEAIPFLKKNREIFLTRRMQPKFLSLFVDMNNN
jgi:hypothetical protein